MLPFAVPAFLENARDLELIGLVLGIIFWIQMIRYCATREAPSMERTSGSSSWLSRPALARSFISSSVLPAAG